MPTNCPYIAVAPAKLMPLTCRRWGISMASRDKKNVETNRVNVTGTARLDILAARLPVLRSAGSIDACAGNLERHLKYKILISRNPDSSPITTPSEA
ncbi:MAG: hypothetical protein RQM92_07915 [Candidatus Syntrophopropionicum ammoniitolerans]